MTKHIIKIFILICCLFIFGQTDSSAQEKPETIHWDISKIPQVGTVTPIISSRDTVLDFILDDFDNDLQQEIGILRSDHNNPFFLKVREIDTNTLPLGNGTSLINHLDLNKLIEFKNHRKYKCLTYRIEEKQGFVDLFNSKLKLVQSIPTIRGEDNNGNGYWDGNVTNAEIVDLNSDDREDLILQFNTGPDEQPRSLFGYDLISKENILKIQFAPMLHQYQIYDLDDNPGAEIIVSLACANHGLYFGEFHRDSSYLAILNSDGTLRKKWSYYQGSSYVDFDIFDINGDHKPDIVSGCYSCMDNAQLTSFIRIIDGKSLSILCEYNIPVKAVIVKVLDLEYDGNPEIIVFDEEGNTGIFHFNKSIEFVCSSTYRGEKKFVLNDDLNGDGIDELFFTCSNPPSVLITNNELRPIAFFPIETYDGNNKKNCRLSSSTFKESQYIFLSNNKLFKATIPVDEVFPPHPFRFSWLGIKLNWGIGKFIGLIFLIILVFLLPILLFMRTKSPVSIPESTRIGWIIIDQSGKIKKYNHTFLKLTHLFHNDLHGSILKLNKQDNYFHDFGQVYNDFIRSKYSHLYKEINTGPPDKRKIFGLELFRMKYKQKNSPVLFLLIDLSETKVTEQAQIWASMAQRVAHKIKTPLGTILLAIQRLQRNYQKKSPELSDEYDKLANTAITEIERVRETINVFMKIARLDSPIFRENDLKEILTEAIREYQRRLPEGVHIKTTFDDHSLGVKIDDKHFKEAVFNIFDNAVTAMESQGQIQIFTQLEAHPLLEYGGLNFAVLEITDDGKGMTKSELQKLFTPGFTTSSHGSGMGLVITKNIIENHNGQIDVHSTEGMGTTFTIRLPVVAKVR